MMIRTPRSIAAHRTGVGWWGASEHLLDGLPPAAIIAPAKGVYQLGGAYVPVGDVLTVSSGTKHVIGPSGLIETVALNTPAIDWSDGRPRLLVEAAAAENMARASQDFSSERWSRSGVTITGGYPAPDGTPTAWRVQGTTTSWNITQFVHRPTIMTVSMWVRSTTGAPQTLRLYANTSTGSTNITVGSTWQRVQFTTAHTAGDAFGFTRDTEGASADLIVWGFQFEPGVVATSYIPTSSAAVTRIADDVRLSAATLAILNGAASTLCLRGQLDAAPVGIQSLVGDVNARRLLYTNGSDTQLASYYGDAIGSATAATGGLSSGFGVVAARVLGGSSKICLNGGAVAALTTDPAETLATARLFADGVGGGACNGWIDELVIWPLIGSDAALQAQAHVYGA